jgi:hypothetical protein
MLRQFPWKQNSITHEINDFPSANPALYLRKVVDRPSLFSLARLSKINTEQRVKAPFVHFMMQNRAVPTQSDIMAPTQEDIQNIMLEATLNAVKLINRFVEKQSISSEEKNAAEIALKFLDLTAQAGRG